MKKWMACLLCALILFPCAAMAVTHDDLSGYAIANGQIMAAEFVDVTAPCSGVLESFDLAAGDRVEEGQALFSMLTAKVTAGEKATVTWVFAAEGERAERGKQRHAAHLDDADRQRDRRKGIGIKKPQKPVITRIHEGKRSDPCGNGRSDIGAKDNAYCLF